MKKVASDMLSKLSLLTITVCLSCNAALVDVSEKLSKDKLVAEIRKLEEAIIRAEPKVEWFRKDMEDKVWEGPFTPEAEQAASFYGNLLIGLGNARLRLSQIKQELMEYEAQEIIG